MVVKDNNWRALSGDEKTPDQKTWCHYIKMPRIPGLLKVVKYPAAADHKKRLSYKLDYDAGF